MAILAAVTLAAAGAAPAGDAPPGLLHPAATQPSAPGKPAIRIGAILPLTGEMAPYGAAAQHGLEAAIARINRNGGVFGRPLQLLPLDTQSKMIHAESLATRAIAVDQVDALIGGLDGTAALAIRPAAERRHTPFLVLSGSYRYPAEGSRYTIRVTASELQLAEAMARFATDTLQVRRPFLVSDVSADQPSLLSDRFGEQFTRLGGQPAGLESVNVRQDLAELAGRIIQAKADAVFVSLQPDQLISLCSTIRNKKVNVPVLAAVPFWALPPLLSADAAVIRPAYVALTFAADDPDGLVRQFVGDMRREPGGGQAGAVAALAYDAVLILAEAARVREDRGGDLRDRIVGLRNLPTVVGPTSFDEFGEVSRSVVICRLAESDPASGGSRLAFVRRLLAQSARPGQATSQPADRNKR